MLIWLITLALATYFMGLGIGYHLGSTKLRTMSNDEYLQGYRDGMHARTFKREREGGAY